MNHLTLCSNNNHLWYPLIVLKCKVHVTFILEDEYRLSLGMLMHIKCIHELGIIILIFQSYLNHIRVISWFYNDFGNTLQFSYFSGINHALAENPIFYILMFQGPKRRPNDLKIYEQQFYKGRRLGSEGSKRTEAWGPKGGGPHGQISWPRGAHYPGPRASDAVDLFPRASSWPKKNYKNSLPTPFGKERRRNTETRNRDLELQIGGGKLRRGAAGVVSNDFSTVSMKKKE